MKKIFAFVFAVMFAVSLSAAGCAKKAASSQEAIQNTETMKTVEEKVNYLVGQANMFINSKDFDQAIVTARYILSDLDSNSTQAKSLLERAETELKAFAEKKIAEAKAEAGKAADDLKNKLGSFGK